jgi:hypothetical protein
MTWFEMTGPRAYDGKIITIGWRDGRLFGNAETCEIVERNAAYLEGKPVGLSVLGFSVLGSPITIT